MKHVSLPPLAVRRRCSNTYEVLDSHPPNSNARRRRKRSSKGAEPEGPERAGQTRSEQSSPKYESADSSPASASPFTPSVKTLERALTDASEASKNATPLATSTSHEGWSRQDQGAAASPMEKAQSEAVDIEEDPPQSFRSYLLAEVNPVTSFPVPDLFWGQTERQRVYNAILYVPYQLERLLGFGLLICCDSFLAVFTVLPIRFVRALTTLRWPLQGQKAGLQGQQLFDALCVFIFASTVFFLRLVNAGTLYFWMKDLTQEFLKLHVIATAVEILDKIACCFVVDSLEALSGTCTLFVSSKQKRLRAWQVAMDTGVALALVLLHAAVLLCQGMTFSVAMNSKRAPALIALIVASNFAEVKGTVFKRFDATKLFALTCQDVVERFHLMLALAFVLAEEMVSAGRAWPSPGLLWLCLHILVAEVAVDVLKHAVLGRFNEVRPGMYREFMRDVSERVQGCQSNTIHRVVSFEPLAPAALFLRVMLTFLAGQRAAKGAKSDVGIAQWCCLGVLAWAFACMAKLSLGHWLKQISYAYSKHYKRRYGKSARPATLRSVAFNTKPTPQSAGRI